MQMLNSLPNQMPDTASEKLLASLQDIASKVEIQSDFCGISHSDYTPLQLQAETVARLQQLPSELQNKYLSLQLCSFLYGMYYSGFLQTVLAPEAESADLAVHQNLENNTFLGVDTAFYERLHESNYGEGNFDPGWSVLRQKSDGSLAVTKDGLTLHVERDRHLQPEAQSAAIGDSVAIRLPRNRMEQGFYLAIGNAGPHSCPHRDTQPEIVGIYFNLSAEGAVAVMGSLTQQLNAIALPFTFKALYNPSDYGRYDSAVFYFDKSNYQAVRSVLQRVYAEHQSHFQAEVPLFTKLLAAGLALAEEPDGKFADQESFGISRCQIVANGLLEAWQKGDRSPEGRMAAILHHFSLGGIELNRPYLNANSEDIYSW